MQFLLASLHAPTTVPALPGAGLWPGRTHDVACVRCPECGWEYVATVAAEVEQWDVERWVWQAAVRLGRECPDHPHRFEIGA